MKITYNVLSYLKSQVLQKRAPPTFIDDAVGRFTQAEQERQLLRDDDESRRSQTGSVASVTSEISIPQSRNPYSRGKSCDYLSTSSINNNRPRSISSLATFDEKNEEEELAAKPSSVPNQSNIAILANRPSSARGIREGESTTDDERKSAERDDLRTSTLDKGLTASMSLNEDGKCQMTKELAKTAVKSGQTHTPASRQISLPVGSGKFKGLNSGNQTPGNNRNRPMLFLIGRLELRLISPDRHQILLNKTFNYVSHCSCGVKYPDHFGFVCRESTQIESGGPSGGWVGYIFRCASPRLVEEIMHCLKTAFNNASSVYQKVASQSKGGSVLSCESCPMRWFHRLCCDVEGADSERTWITIMKAVEFGLSDNEKDEVMTVYSGVKTHSTQEQNELFMIILKGLCEKKQLSHKHPGEEHPQYLEKRSSSIDIFKANIGNSLESLLKSKGKRDDKGPKTKTQSLSEAPKRSGSPLDCTSPEMSPRITIGSKDVFTFDHHPHSDTEGTTKKSSRGNRPRSHTTDADVFTLSNESRSPIKPATPSIFSMFAKIGNNTSSSTNAGHHHSFQSPSSSIDSQIDPSSPAPCFSNQQSSLRQGIFNKIETSIKVRSPSSSSSSAKKSVSFEDETTGGDSSCPPSPLPGQPAQPRRRKKRLRTREELRHLWRTAIRQQLLLIQMEKENNKLRGKRAVMVRLVIVNHLKWSL